MVCRINNLAGGRNVQTWCGGCFWERSDDVMIPMGFWGGGGEWSLWSRVQRGEGRDGSCIEDGIRRVRK